MASLRRDLKAGTPVPVREAAPSMFMREAIRLSLVMMRRGRGGPFGAVVVKEGKIISRGWNCVTSSDDPTAHAEIVAIRRACRRLGSFSLEGCQIYASCEPCPMCLSAIYWARLDAAYYGASRKDAAGIGFDDAEIYRQVALRPQRRSLPMRQLLRDEALRAFGEWRNKSDRVPY